MGLEKFGIKVKSTKKVDPEADAKALVKQNLHHLKCSRPGCKYQRTIRKKVLNSDDRKCGICGTPMKEWTPREKVSNTEPSAEESNEDN